MNKKGLNGCTFAADLGRIIGIQQVMSRKIIALHKKFLVTVLRVKNFKRYIKYC
jgi:hypothetical protein